MDKGGALFGPLFDTIEMATLWSSHMRLQAMLDVEAALACAGADAGLFPETIAAAIAATCDASAFDVEAIGLATAKAGNPVIPIVKALTARVQAKDAQAAKWVHWGATSQDSIDTALVLQAGRACDYIHADLSRLAAALAQLAEEHRTSIMPARTLLQHALPTTFGLKAAGWLSAIMHVQDGLKVAAEAARTIQLGGGAGTLAALGKNGMAITQAFADRLNLKVPAMPWHSQRERMAGLATALGLVAGALGKIAHDISLMMQTEVAEVHEPTQESKGGSSTMPHKRNPVACIVALAAATRAPGLVATMLAAMPQEYERGTGGWHAEWETLPALFCLVAGSARHMAGACEGLEIDTVRMRANLDMTQGLIMAEAAAMALAETIGKTDAHAIVKAASQRAIAEKRPLGGILAEEPVTVGLELVLDPASYLGSANQYIDRIVAQYRSSHGH